MCRAVPNTLEWVRGTTFGRSSVPLVWRNNATSSASGASGAPREGPGIPARLTFPDGSIAGHPTGAARPAAPAAAPRGRAGDYAVPTRGDDRTGLYVAEHPAQLTLLVRGIEWGCDQAR